MALAFAWKGGAMRVLLIASSFNGLTQRVFVELRRLGHSVSVEMAIDDATMVEAATMFKPDVIVCPFLKERLPEALWRQHRCMVVHPGIEGDRGPSSLDWAILEDEATWGVTVLEAGAEFDEGDIWATETFPVPIGVTKSRLYRTEVTDAAVRAVLCALERLARASSEGPTSGDPGHWPRPLDYSRPEVRGRARPLMTQAQRRIDWHRDSTADVIRKIATADGNPGVLDRIAGLDCYMYDAHAEARLTGPCGEIIARRHGAICRATRDGAVWIGHLRRQKSPDGQVFFKLPAEQVLGRVLASVPEVLLDPFARPEAPTLQDIRYRERGAVGVVSWDFYNGAMSAEQCERLRVTIERVRNRPVRVIVLAGGQDAWSNGIHLNRIQADPDPALESMVNIEAIDDLVHTVLTTDRQLTVSALGANAGAGGVVLAAAADVVVARSSVVLNPHYRTMGLYGSEYWTYVLPHRVGASVAHAMTERCLPMGAAAARSVGLVDAVLDGDYSTFQAAVARYAMDLAGDRFEARLGDKAARRATDEARKPLAAYREAELAEMSKAFDDPASAYHTARRRFVYKARATATPEHIAAHRALQGTWIGRLLDRGRRWVGGAPVDLDGR
jgi:putative two-component system protein, hydrogenase maturation factor HypX/HoxX